RQDASIDGPSHGPIAAQPHPMPAMSPAAAERRAEIARLRQDLAEIPGTYVFDAEKSRRGYHLNMFCIALKNASNRQAFQQDPHRFLDRYPLTDDQKQAVLARDYNRLLALGGNIYFLSKIAATDGESFQQIASRMTGIPLADYREIMRSGGQSPETMGEDR